VASEQEMVLSQIPTCWPSRRRAVWVNRFFLFFGCGLVVVLYRIVDSGWFRRTILPRPAKALVHSALASVFSRGVYERSRFSVLLRLPGSNPSRRFLFRVSHRPPMSADSSCIRRTLEPGKHQSGGTPKRMQSRLGL